MRNRSEDRALQPLPRPESAVLTSVFSTSFVCLLLQGAILTQAPRFVHRTMVRGVFPATDEELPIR